jgi:hypothetical protein
MYESAMIEATSLGHANMSTNNGSPISNTNTKLSSSNPNQNAAGVAKKDSVLGELGDFF